MVTLTLEQIQNIAFLCIGFFFASLVYEIAVYRKRLKQWANAQAERKANSEALNSQLHLLTQSISMWGRAILELKAKVILKDEAKTNGTKEQSTGNERTEDWKGELKREISKAVGTNTKEKPLDTR